jgi:hypothetical protein
MVNRGSFQPDEKPVGLERCLTTITTGFASLDPDSINCLCISPVDRISCMVQSDCICEKSSDQSWETVPWSDDRSWHDHVSAWRHRELGEYFLLKEYRLCGIELFSSPAFWFQTIRFGNVYGKTLKHIVQGCPQLHLWLY